MKKWIWLILSLCLPVSCMVDESGEDKTETTDIVKVGDRLPSFSVEVTDGGEQSVFSSDRLSGETVIVFFNTGCSDCQRELPELNAYYLQHRDEPGFQMVAIAREEGEASIASYWQEHDLSIPYSPQADRRIFNLFATLTIPRVYICSATGIVNWMGVEDFDL